MYGLSIDYLYDNKEKDGQAEARQRGRENGDIASQANQGRAASNRGTRQGERHASFGMGPRDAFGAIGALKEGIDHI